MGCVCQSTPSANDALGSHFWILSQCYMWGNTKQWETTMRNCGMMRTGDNAITHWGRGWGSRWGEGLNWGAGARANPIPWYQEIRWRSGDTATARLVSFIITSNETTSAESPAFCHAPECASSLGKIKCNYHLKELTHKRVKARAWAWFSLAVYLA